jgi:nicotinamidase-related amidase
MGAFTLTPGSTAIVIIDMQNDTVHEKGAFAETGAAAHAQSQNVIANISRIVDAARSAGITVIHNRIVVYPNPAVGGANAPIFRMLGPESFAVDSWGAAIVDELTPAAGELVLDRIRMSAFHGTALDTVLRNLGVRDVVIVGAWTNMAVEHTVRDAADFGYAATVVSDATSSLSPEWQEAALGFALTNIATIVSTDAVVKSLEP